MNSQLPQPEEERAWWAWLVPALAALAVLVIVGLALGTGSRPLQWDEKYIVPIIDRIFRTGWNTPALIDYDDTKGPAFFWLYAGFAEIFGPNTAVLRSLSIIMTALWTALMVGLLDVKERRAGRIALVVLLALTLPYSLVISQLAMSEPSFLLGCAVMAVAAVAALRRESHRAQLVEGPIVFGVLFAVLLHHRIHVVAPAGAILMVAIACERWKSWPWLVAGLIAGLSRIPLWVHWGGLVGPSYQDRYRIGLRLDSLVYLSAALLPTIGLTLVAAIMRRRELGRRRLGVILVLGGLGAGMAAMAVPGVSSDPQVLNFAGPVATLLRPIADSPMLLSGAFASLCALGMMSMAAMVALTWPQTRDASPLVRCGSQMACLTIVFGWLLSAVAGGDVYDRYLLAFTFLWPVLCVRMFPRALVAVQVLWQLALTAAQVQLHL